VALTLEASSLLSSFDKFLAPAALKSKKVLLTLIGRKLFANFLIGRDFELIFYSKARKKFVTIGHRTTSSGPVIEFLGHTLCFEEIFTILSWKNAIAKMNNSNVVPNVVYVNW
jgi:hypothetical protein